MWSISSSIKLKIAIRGYGNHAKRIEKILKLKEKIEIYQISRDFLENEIRENTKGIIICSPNATHKGYIEKSLSFYPDMPIYCEKPILNNSHDFDETVQLVKTGKIFPGFNLRRSYIKKLLEDYKYKLGDIKSFMIYQTYPFGLKKSYLNSWKSDYKLSNLGVLENLSIHYIDLSYYLFGEEDQKEIILSDFLNSVPRNCDTLIKHKNGVVTSIHNSYSEILNSQMILNFDEGKIVIDDNGQSIYSPTLNLDEELDLCLESPLISFAKKSFEELFEDSLEKSVELYIQKIDQGYLKCIDDSLGATISTLKTIRDAYRKNVL